MAMQRPVSEGHDATTDSKILFFIPVTSATWGFLPFTGENPGAERTYFSPSISTVCECEREYKSLMGDSLHYAFGLLCSGPCSAHAAEKQA